MSDNEESITVQVLIGIRADLASLKSAVNDLRDEQVETRQDLGRRIDQTNLQLKTSETRLATEISALRSVVTDTEPDRSLEERMEQCERDIAELRSQR